MSTATNDKLKVKILALEQQVEQWKQAYFEAIKHDGRVIAELSDNAGKLKPKEAQDGTAE